MPSATRLQSPRLRFKRKEEFSLAAINSLMDLVRKRDIAQLSVVSFQLLRPG
jgi:hypothetical protein